MRVNKLVLIKFIHSVIYFFMLACLLYILYGGITKTYNWSLLVAISAILLEGLVLILNHGRCPFTTLAERLGAEDGSVTDIFLPHWMARNVFKLFTVLFAAELLLLGFGYLLK